MNIMNPVTEDAIRALIRDEIKANLRIEVEEYNGNDRYLLVYLGDEKIYESPAFSICEKRGYY